LSKGGEKRRSSKLGWWLSFCVVYADIGTSIFYVPGILFLTIGSLATMAQVLTTGVFILIARKYVEIATRCPDGGGVVSIAHKAFPTRKMLPLLGGSLITIDYFLTSAISGVSGFAYLQSLFGFNHDLIVPMTLCALALLLVLNIVGLKESASVNAVFAATKLVVSAILVVMSTVVVSSMDGWAALFDQVLHPTMPGGQELTASALVIGYADTWLAYSGLESGAQISSAMAHPIKRTASIATWMVIAAISILSPLLTAYAIFMLSGKLQAVPAEQVQQVAESFMSALAFEVGGVVMQTLVVISASTLLIMACNTAMVGNYHVNARLVGDGYLPGLLGRRSKRFGTPVISIALSAIVPMFVVLGTRGEVSDLGDLYSFGLLGALTLSSVSIDWLHWKDKARGPKLYAGMATSLALLLAWGINIVNKPASLFFGGSLTLLFMGLGFGVQRGYFARLAERFPMFGPLLVEQTVARSDDSRVLTLTEAEDLSALYPVGTIVAVREASPSLLRAAADWANKQGERAVCVLYVEEVPGLFYPPKLGPSEEASRVLSESVRQLEARDVKGIPVWRMSHDAADSVAGAARNLKAKLVLVGVSRRSTLWKVLRGHVVRGLKKHLPDGVELRIVP